MYIIPMLTSYRHYIYNNNIINRQNAAVVQCRADSSGKMFEYSFEIILAEKKNKCTDIIVLLKMDSASSYLIFR